MGRVGHEQPWWKHSVAGSCAGVMEHIGMYPLDTIKTHMQALRPGGQVHLSDILRTIAEENGGRGFMRGCSAIASGCVPAHVAMFTSLSSQSRILAAAVAPENWIQRELRSVVLRQQYVMMRF